MPKPVAVVPQPASPSQKPLNLPAEVDSLEDAALIRLGNDKYRVVRVRYKLESVLEVLEESVSRSVAVGALKLFRAKTGWLEKGIPFTPAVKK